MKRYAISAVRTALHLLLYPLEFFLRVYFAKAKPQPPIFIIGAPRSGTSLLYELLITRYRFAYLSNLAHRFYLTPLAASWIGRRLIGKWRGNFSSRYGHIDGWGAPNEGGWIWRRWLQDGDWTDGTDFRQDNIAPLRALTNGISGVFSAPFINKNVMHSNRLLLMQKIWPDALYILVERDMADNARSIIRAERKEGGPAHDRDHWWSVRPSIAPQFIGKSDVERAAAQVIGVHQDIMRDIKFVGNERMITISYSALCQNSTREISKIRDFLSANGILLKDNISIPEFFETRPSAGLDNDEEMQLASLINKF